MRSILAALVALLSLFVAPAFAKDPLECEVCLRVLGNLVSGLSPAEKKDLGAIESKLGSFARSLAMRGTPSFATTLTP